MDEYSYYIYLLSNNRNTVIYTGVTNDLFGRVLWHKEKKNPKSFTARYNVEKIVYLEEFD